ncbi:MAG: hypothetical protein O7G85_10635 [Planctomycetota bacterium]|nr:hypothetical protein [Planctomycetota bacterium]
MNSWRSVNNTTGKILACVAMLGLLCSGSVLLAFTSGPLACDQHEAALHKRQKQFFGDQERMINEARRETSQSLKAQYAEP